MQRNTSSTPDQDGRWVITEFGGPSVLKWQTWNPRSELPSDKILVRIITAGIAGPDNIQRAGGYPDPRCAKPGFTPGSDFVGEIVALGSEASGNPNLAVGDRVASMCNVGAHATHIIISPNELIRIDPSDDPVLACALPLNYMTAWGMLKRNHVNLTPGSSILIGSVSGGIGTAIAQLVHAFDLDLKMLGTCSPSKFDYVRSLGVIPVDREAPDLVEQIRSLTGGEGVDVAYDAVGSEVSLLKSHQATKKDVGQVIAIGVMADINVDGSGLHVKADKLSGIVESRMEQNPRTAFFSVTLHYSKKTPDVFRDDFMAILDKVRKQKLIPEVFRLLRLDQAIESNEILISGKGVKGRMVFVVDEELAKKHGQ